MKTKSIEKLREKLPHILRRGTKRQQNKLMKAYHGKRLKQWWAAYAKAEGVTISQVKEFEDGSYHMKGGHTHNAFYNALNRLVFRGKNSRQFHRKKQFKKEYVAIFYENMKIKENHRLIMETLNKHTRKMSGKPLEAECHS